jgi:hypothetical protein
MKVLFSIVLVIVTLPNANTQPKGVDFDKAVIFNKANYEDNYERLCKLPDVTEGYMFYFRNSTIGVKHSLDKVLELLNVNNLSFDEPDLNRDYLGVSITGITDYENISYYTSMDQAEIYRVWLIEDGPWGIKWAIRGGLVSVIIQNFTNEELARISIVEVQREQLRQNELERQRQAELERQRQAELERQSIQQSKRINNAENNAFGTPGTDRRYTDGGLGDGISFGGLGSRRGSLPKPNLSGCEVTQKIEITVDIQVDRDGSVVSAVVKSGTYQDKCIWDMVLEAVKKSRFSPDQNAGYRQTGWIKYIIVP